MDRYRLGRLALALASALSALCTAAHVRAEPFEVARVDGESVTLEDVAYNKADDEFLILWSHRGTIYGQLRSADGTILVPELVLFVGSSSARYRQASATFKSGQNLYMIAAIEETTVGRGAAALATSRVTVRGFSSDGERLWSLDLPSGVRPWDYFRHPDITADSRSDGVAAGDLCCAMVVWEESFGTIRGARLRADGTISAEHLVYSGLETDRAMNPQVAFQKLPISYFAVGYQGTSPPRIEMRAIQGATVGTPSVIATLSETPARGARFQHGFALTYNQTARRFLAVWGVAGSARGRLVRPGLEPALSAGLTSVSASGSLSYGAIVDTPIVATALDDQYDFVVRSVQRADRYEITSNATAELASGSSEVRASSPTRVRRVRAIHSPLAHTFLFLWEQESAGGVLQVLGSTAPDF